MLVMIGQQITGQVFMSQYGIIFYQRNGFADQAFELNIILNPIGVVAIMLTWFMVDSVGSTLRMRTSTARSDTYMK